MYMYMYVYDDAKSKGLKWPWRWDLRQVSVDNVTQRTKFIMYFTIKKR